MRSSKTVRKRLIVAFAVWQVAPSCWNQMPPYPPHSISRNKIVQQCPVTLSIDGYGHSSLIFEDKWTNDASRPKSAPNSDSLWMHRFFFECVRVFWAPNAAILLVNIPAKMEMSFIRKVDDTFCNITMIFKVMSQYFPAFFERIHNHFRSAEE